MTAAPAGTAMDWRREIAAGYERSWRRYRPYVALCLRYGEPGRRIDLGAGLGYFTECYHRFGIPCRGYEGSPEAIEEALHRAPDLDLQLHDLEAPLPEPDGSVSVAFCNQVIEHLEPAATLSLLREVRRILAPGGLLYVGSPSRFNREQRTELHINLLAPAELQALLIEAGFDEVWPIDYPKSLPGPPLLGKLLSGAFFFLAPLDRLSASANALAFVAPYDGPRPGVRGSRHAHLRRALGY